MPLHVSSTVVLIIRRSKLYYTASGIIITPVGGRPVHTSLSTCAPDGHLQNACLFSVKCYENLKTFHTDSKGNEEFNKTHTEGAAGLTYMFLVLVRDCQPEKDIFYLSLFML